MLGLYASGPLWGGAPHVGEVTQLRTSLRAWESRTVSE